jgi:hypothetical protein
LYGYTVYSCSCNCHAQLLTMSKKTKHGRLPQQDPEEDIAIAGSIALVFDEIEQGDSRSLVRPLKMDIILHSKWLFAFFASLVVLCGFLAVILTLTHKNTNSSPNAAQSPVDSADGVDVLFRKRSEYFINTSLLNYPDNKHNLIFQAYRGEEIIDIFMQEGLNLVAENGQKADFAMADLVRIHFLTSDYADEIKAAAESFRFWLTYKEEDLVYWSENKAISFMSAHWLFHERYGWETYDYVNLRTRLLHYLQLKNSHGYYEFFSKVYSPYTLAALLNLVDFAQDEEIVLLAAGAARRLLGDMLMVTNDLGVAYSVAGRDYWKVLYDPTDQNFNIMVYLLTGLHPDASSDMPPPSQLAGHLATTTLDVSVGGIYEYWNTTVDRSFYNGQSMESVAKDNANLTFVDRVLALWTTGGCCDSSNIIDSYDLVDSYEMWEHPDLAELAVYHGASHDTLLYVTTAHASQIVGRSTSGAIINIFKRQSIALSSLELWNPGMYGVQTIPWVASTGSLAVWGAVGSARFAEHIFLPDKGDGCETNGLPYVSQQSNVALIIYFPDSSLKSYLHGLGLNTDVVIHWPEHFFDETAQSSDWLFGREEEAYVAVKRGFSSQSDDVVRAVRSLYTNATVQAWAVVIGCESMHGNFSNFVSVVSSALWTNEMVTNSMDKDGSILALPQLHSKLQVDGKIVEITTFTK